MKTRAVITLALVALIILVLMPMVGCSMGGADVYLQGVSIGAVSVEGKPVTGLPSQNVDVVLKVNAKQVNVSMSGGKTTIKLTPSETTIVTGPDGISFTGVKPEQVQVKWQTAK